MVDFVLNIFAHARFTLYNQRYFDKTSTFYLNYLDTLSTCDQILLFSKTLIYMLHFRYNLPLKEEGLWIKFFRVKSKTGNICMDKGNVQYFIHFYQIVFISSTMLTGNFEWLFHHHSPKSHDHPLPEVKMNAKCNIQVSVYVVLTFT